MVSFNLKVLAKFGLCSNCSQKLDGYSLARARKNFATACQMLVLAKINTLLECSQRPFYNPNNVIYSDIVLFTRGKNAGFVSVIFHRAGEIALQDGTIPPLLEPPNATAIVDKIFVDYDKRLRPFYGGDPVEIFISMGFISISNIIEENMVTISNVYLSTSRTQNYSLFVAYQ